MKLHHPNGQAQAAADCTKLDARVALDEIENFCTVDVLGQCCLLRKKWLRQNAWCQAGEGVAVGDGAISQQTQDAGS